MQHGTVGNYDDYGFLTSKGLVFATSQVTKPSFRSVEDLLAHSNGILKTQTGGTRSQTPHDYGYNRLHTGCISRKMSSSQPNLRKCKADDKWNIRVRFDTEHLQTEIPSSLKQCKKNSKKAIRHPINETVQPDIDDVKRRSWWKSLFSSKKRNDTKLSNGKIEHSKRSHSVRNVANDSTERVIEDEVDTGTHLSCVKEETSLNQQFQILELSKSPCLHKRITDSTLSENPVTSNDCSDGSIYHPGRSPTLSSSQRTSTRLRKSKSKKKRNSSSEATQKSTTSTRRSPKITHNKQHAKLSKIDERHMKNNTHDDAITNKICRSIPNSTTGAAETTCTAKYRVNKAKEKKVLVHIQTKEEMPIKDGIPQWHSLSYQCIPRSVISEEKLQPITTQIVESSFIGECIRTPTEIELANRNTLVGAAGSVNSSKFSAGTTAVSSCNVGPRNALRMKDSMDFEKPKRLSSTNSEASTNAAEIELNRMCHRDDEQPKPSYFEVTAEVNVANESRAPAGLTSKQSEECGDATLAGVTNDKVPEIIARKHPYLISSSPLRHLAKCLRNAHSTQAKPITKQISDAAQTFDINTSTAVIAPDVHAIEASILSKASEAESSDSFAVLLGVAQQAAQKTLLCSQRCFSDSDLSATGFFMKARSSRKKESNERSNAAQAEANCVTERLSQTQQILARMRERVSRLEILSDGGDKQKMTTPAHAFEPAVHHIPVQKSKSINACDDIVTTKMSSLPLPAISRSNSLDFENAGSCELKKISTAISVDHQFSVNPTIGKQQTVEERKLNAYDYDGNSPKYLPDQTQNQCSVSASVTSLEKLRAVDSKKVPVRRKLNEIAIAKSQRQTSPILKNTEIVESKAVPKGDVNEAVVVGSPTRRRLRIMPFTLPLPKSTKYTDDDFFPIHEQNEPVYPQSPTMSEYTINDDHSDVSPITNETADMYQDGYSSSNEQTSHRSSQSSTLESTVNESVTRHSYLVMDHSGQRSYHQHTVPRFSGSDDEIDNCIANHPEYYSENRVNRNQFETESDADSFDPILGKHSYKELEDMLLQQDRARQTILQEMQAIIKSRNLTLDQRVNDERQRGQKNYKEQHETPYWERNVYMPTSSRSVLGETSQWIKTSPVAAGQLRKEKLSIASQSCRANMNDLTRKDSPIYNSLCDTVPARSNVFGGCVSKRIPCNAVDSVKPEMYPPHDSARTFPDGNRRGQNGEWTQSRPENMVPHMKESCDLLPSPIQESGDGNREVPLPKHKNERKVELLTPAPLSSTWITSDQGEEKYPDSNVQKSRFSRASKSHEGQSTRTTHTQWDCPSRRNFYGSPSSEFSDGSSHSSIHKNDMKVASSPVTSSSGVMSHRHQLAHHLETSTPQRRNDKIGDPRNANKDNEFHKYWGFVHKKHTKIYISGLSYDCDDYETDL